MLFGLTNVPTIFQHMMNDIFEEYLDHFVVIYLDDILIYFKNEEEHKYHVCLVLEKLRELKIEFLDYIISSNGISMDEKKIKLLWIG